ESEHGAVDLARPHADAAAVDRCVRAAADDGGPALGDLDPVAVPPDPRVRGEVAVAVAASVGVTPQEEGHGRHRLGDHELSDLADQRSPLGIPRLDACAESAPLQLAAVYGKRGDTA